MRRQLNKEELDAFEEAVEAQAGILMNDACLVAGREGAGHGILAIAHSAHPTLSSIHSTIWHTYLHGWSVCVHSGPFRIVRP
jgi:hypothetical protein